MLPKSGRCRQDVLRAAVSDELWPGLAIASASRSTAAIIGKWQERQHNSRKARSHAVLALVTDMRLNWEKDVGSLVTSAERSVLFDPTSYERKQGA